MSTEKPRLIVAVNTQGVIAVNGQIPWKKPADLKRFKAVTMGGTLIMGRKTWESMGRRFLPGRRTIVLSRTVQSDVETAHSLEQAIELAKDKTWANGTWEKVEWPGENIWIVGGAEVYEQALPLVDEIDLTLVIGWFLPTGETREVTKFSSFVNGFDGVFQPIDSVVNEDDHTLIHCRCKRV